MLTIEELTQFRSVSEPLSWVGHMPFAKFLVTALRPMVMVELGTHGGNSYFAFCQAAAEQNLNCRLFAVDTWKGEEHAGFYTEKVFQSVNEHNELHYAGFSTLKRMTFDDALCDFEDTSIDILHIDGFHSYEAVRHDFETWIGKVKASGVVLFHDITERRDGFGVWQLWAELTQRYPTLEFHHFHGLGVLFVDERVRQKLIDGIRELVLSDPSARRFFEVAGLLVSERFNSRTQLDQLTSQVIELEESLRLKCAEERRMCLVAEDQRNARTQAESELAQERRARAEMESSLQELHARLSDVMQSSSWRVTAPARALFNLAYRARKLLADH